MVAKPPPGHFNVLYFAIARSFTAKEFESYPAPLSISKLFDTLETRHAGIKAKILDSSLVTINLNYVDMPDNSDNPNQLVIKEGDEVAIIPPVSSGLHSSAILFSIWNIIRIAAQRHFKALDQLSQIEERVC
ncbi:hypothetical protein G7054_g1079 [Neopestalotiopsis clavispora]|nr:hypothetical protein G7054_g1079 [Neopestalotiopsis clavispora]